MSPPPQPTSINPTHLKIRFAHRFFRALKNINTTTHENNPTHQRSRRVKIASYKSMASVVGSRRAWSRAVLRKTRNGSRNRRFFRVHHKRRNPNPKRKDFDPFGHSGQESKLRRLVPGASTMDSCRLLDETADYIKCLGTQVEVMRTILEFYTTT